MYARAPPFSLVAVAQKSAKDAKGKRTKAKRHPSQGQKKRVGQTRTTTSFCRFLLLSSCIEFCPLGPAGCCFVWWAACRGSGADPPFFAPRDR